MKLSKGSRKLLLIVLVLYIISPLDLLPGIQIDDLAALIGLIITWIIPTLEDGG